MEILFDVTDPRGKQVICTKECWNNHILSNRPFMQDSGWAEEVEKAITKPTFGIYQDAKRTERYIYYLLSAKKTRYMKVVVSFTEDKGDVITAFPTNNMKAGEKLIWTASDQ